MNIWERQKQIIEGIDEELKELIETQARIAAKKKKLEAARDSLAPEPWEIVEKVQPAQNKSYPHFSLPKSGGGVPTRKMKKRVHRKEPLKSPRIFLNKEFRGMSVVDACRQAVHLIKMDSFRERDISRFIFNYAPGMDADRSHSACSTALIKLEGSGDLKKLEIGLYQKSRS